MNDGPEEMNEPDTRPEMLGSVRSWELWPILVPFIVIFIAYGYWRWT